MTTYGWGAQLTTRVAEQIRRHRKAAGLTVAETADACTARGLPVPKTTITNLETGRRSSVDLAEFLVLADVLGVPPITLLFPLDTAPTVDVLPGQPVSTWNGLAWFTGETASTEAAPKGSPRELLDLFRAHGDAVAAARASTSLAKERRRMANTTLDPARRTELLDAATGYEQFAFDDCRALGAFRDSMRERGLVPPELPADLAFVDQSKASSKDTE
ncbi:helix-turn-helix domain-containing protein [Streptomyces tailanensis]|uniref:helix-turn-helix domain-containing protein n=1 Tax=Streptomyces tailanensis TaxID=2569858 RepID=UPI00122E4B89|nr:helix-turn-helix transcriptional regulator [Streptomyces tailanensis]